jgi:chloramphenicol-sensitive protein RarD
VASLSAPSGASPTESGLIAGFAAYLLWGFLPLLFGLLRDVGAVTIVADRTLCSLVFVGLLLLALKGYPEVRQVLGDRRTVARMAVAAVLLAANWLIFVFAVEAGHVLEASFGYFINPLANVALGILFLGERLNRVQLAAIVVALVAVLIQAVGIGSVPYIALSLAFSFAAYGFLRKTVKASAAAGLFIETLVLAPVALGYILYTFWRDGGIGPLGDPYTAFLLLLTGPGTAVPLLLFAIAVKRLKLSTVGMLQYLSPSIAFILAITVFGEELNLTRAISFGLIWLSLIIYSSDGLLRHRARSLP